MEQRPLEYTVKIYCEGFTEWYYFEWLRTNNRFKFSMEPDIPKNSRSSYKQNLKLIDKELRKNPQERADAIFLVIDTDTLVKNKAQYAIYQEAKEKEKNGRSRSGWNKDITGDTEFTENEEETYEFGISGDFEGEE